MLLITRILPCQHISYLMPPSGSQGVDYVITITYDEEKISFPHKTDILSQNAFSFSFFLYDE